MEIAVLSYEFKIIITMLKYTFLITIEAITIKIFCQQEIRLFLNIKIRASEAGEDSVVKRTYCSFKGSGFGS